MNDEIDLESKIAAIIKEIYAGDGYQDEGRSDQAAHDIMALIKTTLALSNGDQ